MLYYGFKNLFVNDIMRLIILEELIVMARQADTAKRLKNSDRYQISIFLDPKDVEEVKAISIAKDTSLGSVIVNLMREGLKNEEYQKTIQAYRQFKSTVG